MVDSNSFTDLFVTRAKCRPVRFEVLSHGSRPAPGPPLLHSVAKTPNCEVCGRSQRFWLAISDVLWEESFQQVDSVARSSRARRTWAIFLCADFTCLLQGTHQLRPSPISIVEQWQSAKRDNEWTRSDNSVFAQECRLVADGPISDAVEFGEVEGGSKVGGRPRWVQGEPRELLRQLEQQELAFLMQINEESYPDSMSYPTYALGMGVLYLFAPLRFLAPQDNDSGLRPPVPAGDHTTMASPMAAFWQC